MIPELQISASQMLSFAIAMISIFGFVLTYNKAVKNSVDKKDMADMKADFETKNRAIYHHIDDFKKDNEKDHERIERVHSEQMKEIRESLRFIQEHIINCKVK